MKKDVTVIKPNFKTCMFLHMQTLTNFPFIEDDFDALTNYELLCKVVEYLNKVIANDNKQNENIEELALALNQLKYELDHLDLQDEVNNRLDEMAEDGELAEIISEFLNSNAIIGFDTVAILKETEMLVAGSYARTCGKITYNDGLGAYYRVRERLNSDVPDDDNIVVLVNTDNLVAEKTFSKDIQDINDEIDFMNSNDTIFLGDSYAAGTTYESGSVQFLTSWCEYLRRLMGLTSGHYFILAQGNAGFAKIGNNSKNFQMTLEAYAENIPDPNAIKNIIVCAGYNDHDQDTSLIYQRIGEFITYCKTTYPNAQVYIGMIGGDARDSSTGATIRNDLINKVLNAYSRCTEYGGIYLTGVENFTHNFFQFNNQGNHPNEAGYNYVARMIYNAWKNGAAVMYEPITNLSLPTNFNNLNWNMQVTMLNGTKTLYIDNYIANDINLSSYGDSIQIIPANTSNKLVKPNISNKLQVPCDLTVQLTNNSWIHVPARLIFTNDGSVSLLATWFVFNKTLKSIVIWPTTTTHSILVS